MIYSPIKKKLYYYLTFNDVKNADECEALLWRLEREFG